MKESDYIAATSVARVRIAMSVLRDVFPDGQDITKEELYQIRAAVAVWEMRLAKRLDPGTKETPHPWPIQWAAGEGKP